MISKRRLGFAFLFIFITIYVTILIFSDSEKATKPTPFVVLPDNPLYPEKKIEVTVPVLSLHCRDDIQKKFWMRCNVQVYDKEHKSKKLKAFIKISGNPSYPKKSFSIRLKKRKSLLSLQKSNNWLIGSLYRDPTLIRKKLSIDLFREMSPNTRVPNAQFVEVFVEDTYQGIYLLSEKVNRELFDYRSFRSALHGSSLIFRISPKSRYDSQDIDYLKFNNLSFEQVFPDIYKSSYNREKVIVDLFKSVETEESEQIFKVKLKNKVKLSIDNIVDFYIHALFTGNRLKNDYYITMSNPLNDHVPEVFFIPFNNDSIFGIRTKFALNQEHKMYYRFPFNRFLKNDRFKHTFINRWKDLRATILNETTIISKIKNYYDNLGIAIERNNQRWPRTLEVNDSNNIRYFGFRQNIEYLKHWIEKQLLFLDKAVEEIISTKNIENKL